MVDGVWIWLSSTSHIQCKYLWWRMFLLIFQRFRIWWIDMRYWRKTYDTILILLSYCFPIQSKSKARWSKSRMFLQWLWLLLSKATKGYLTWSGFFHLYMEVALIIWWRQIYITWRRCWLYAFTRTRRIAVVRPTVILVRQPNIYIVRWQIKTKILLTTALFC